MTGKFWTLISVSGCCSWTLRGGNEWTIISDKYSAWFMDFKHSWLVCTRRSQVKLQLFPLDYIPVKILGQLGVLTFVNPAVMAKAVIGTNIMAIPGISIKLGCPYSGRPKPDITWYVNDTKIDRYEKYPVGKGSNDMIIPKMTQEYVGKYTCVASQGKKKSSGSSTIKLLGKEGNLDILSPGKNYTCLY